MKKILFVINSLELGGAEKSLVSLLSTFDFDKYEVDLLMFRVSGMFLKLLPAKVNVLSPLAFLSSGTSLLAQLKHPGYLAARARASFGLRKNNKTKKLHPAQCYWKYTSKCFETLDKEYDVAVAWGQGNPTHYVAEKVNADKKLAVINVNYEGAGHNKEFDYQYYRKFNYIIAVSEELGFLVKQVFHDFKEKTRVIYDINNAELILKMAADSNPFENEKNVLKIVTAGRLTNQKGYDLAVEAAKILKSQGVKFKWYFIGEGVCRSSLEAMIDQYDLSDMVILAGAQDNPYVYIKNADIYVQTSRFEGYCLTIAEARILNKPIVSTDFDVVHNQIISEENGIIVDMNPKSIADAIVRLYSEKGLCAKLINNLSLEKKGNTEEVEKWYSLIENE